MSRRLPSRLNRFVLPEGLSVTRVGKQKSEGRDRVADLALFYSGRCWQPYLFSGASSSLPAAEPRAPFSTFNLVGVAALSGDVTGATPDTGGASASCGICRSSSARLVCAKAGAAARDAAPTSTAIIIERLISKTPVSRSDLLWPLPGHPFRRPKSSRPYHPSATATLYM